MTIVNKKIMDQLGSSSEDSSERKKSDKVVRSTITKNDLVRRESTRLINPFTLDFDQNHPVEESKEDFILNQVEVTQDELAFSDYGSQDEDSLLKSIIAHRH
jgi:hypothetical protein